jgi:anaerobic selenocysteine-containing dehydrogenase
VWSGSVVDGEVLEGRHLLAGRQPRWFNMSRLAEILTETTSPPIRGLLVWNCNPLMITPNVEKIRAGVMRDDLFMVVHEQFITDTARYADIVLPATTQIEATDVVPPWGHLWLSWNEAAIEPCGESVSNSELFRRLAKAMGYTEPELFDDDLTAIRTALPDIDVDELRRVGYLRVPYPDDGRPFGDGVFPTASGRVEFVSEALVAMGQPALPTFVAPVEGPGTVLAERYPLQLMTPKHHTRFLNGSYSHLAGHGGRERGPFLELCAADAASRGIVDGQCVQVFNDRGSLEVPARISDRLRPGLVSIPWGWWSRHHPDGMVANSLTNDTLTEWGGGAAFYDTLVEVAPH